jgi:hypothetical protein
MKKSKLTAAQRTQLLDTLSERFAKHPKRHAGIDWKKVAAKLDDGKLWSLSQMEATGGEPDVIGQDKGGFLFVDCAAESPKGRRSICYDRAARLGRKEAPPKGDAETMAADLGIELLDETQYRALQKLGEFDLKTSSWILTPAPIRKLGGAVFMDRRYDTVFLYHNGAESYYAARGFRGVLRV